MACSFPQNEGRGAAADSRPAAPQTPAREHSKAHPEVAPPANHVKHDGPLRRLMRHMRAVSLWHFAAMGGIFLLLSWAAGVVLWLAGANGDGGNVPRPLSASRLEKLGYTPALATRPWDPANTQWMMGAAFATFFAFRKYAFPALTRKLYGELPVQKQVKIANYMLELVGTSLALLVSFASGLFDVLFFPDDYLPIPTPEQAWDIAWGLQLMPVFFVPMYIIELAFDELIRPGLMLHHWLSVVLVLWGCIVEFQMRHNMAAVRLYVALSLYMSTEQNVFVEMLAYYRNIYWPCLFTLSAWYYLLSRAFIMAMSLYTWWECRDAVFVDGEQNSAIVYALWLFVPAANVILNATQVTTVTSLFGIARTVRKRAREQAAAVQQPLPSTQRATSPAARSIPPSMPLDLPTMIRSQSRRPSCKSARSARSCRSLKSLSEDVEGLMTPLAFADHDEGEDSSGAEAAPNPAQVIRDAVAAMQLDSQFQGAQAAVKSLGHVSDQDKLRLYALYKQALHGPARPSEKPGMFQVVARAKWEAWARLEDMEASIAKQQYVEVANELKPGWQDCP